MAVAIDPPGFPFNSQALSLEILPVALLGSYAIGFPIALLVYALAGRQLGRSPANVGLVAGLASVVMILASIVIGGASGVLIFGVPATLAAVVFAVLGWFWILKPLGEQRISALNEGENQ